MFSTLKKLQARKTALKDSAGFTLIELLIVIVVLGILAAVVVFSLGSVTSKSAVAACQADGATVNTAMAAFSAENGSTAVTQALLLGTLNGGPYLQSWPSNPNHYFFSIAGGKLYEAIGNSAGTLPSTTAPASPWNLWAGASTCVSTGSKPTVS